MDIPRPSQAGARRRKRILLGAVGIVLVGAITVGLGWLEPAAPSVDRNVVWVDTVQRGPMVRQVRGLGTLVPEDVRWIAARTEGRVNQIFLRPGASVEPDSVILLLINPDVTEAAEAADSELVAAEAELVYLKVDLERQLLEAESVRAKAKADYEQSRLRAEVNEELFRDGLVSPLELQLSRVIAEEAATRHEIEIKRFTFTQDSIAPQLAVKEAQVARTRAQTRLRRAEADALHVRAGMAGVLQQLPLEIGQQVLPGANLARVADPARLKAEIRIAETQARDIQIGQLARVDTRNGIIDGRVSRIDPAVHEGTVLVDVTLEGKLPRGARPDLSVDGMIELERLDDVVFVGRPAFGQEGSTIGLFKLGADGTHAARSPVELGRSSVDTIEILGGLAPGDRVILSDMSQWDTTDRIRLH